MWFSAYIYTQNDHFQKWFWNLQLQLHALFNWFLKQHCVWTLYRCVFAILLPSIGSDSKVWVQLILGGGILLWCTEHIESQHGFIKGIWQTTKEYQSLWQTCILDTSRVIRLNCFDHFVIILDKTANWMKHVFGMSRDVAIRFSWSNAYRDTGLLSDH